MLTAITDESGETVATFDLSRADRLATTRRHNKGNWDSRWVNLLRTAKGAYVTEHENQWQEELTSYRLAKPNEAARFLARWRQGHDPDVPTDLQKEVLAALEVRGSGPSRACAGLGPAFSGAHRP